VMTNVYRCVDPTQSCLIWCAEGAQNWHWNNDARGPKKKEERNKELDPVSPRTWLSPSRLFKSGQPRLAVPKNIRLDSGLNSLIRNV
jgi:hypothetical protein